MKPQVLTMRTSAAAGCASRCPAATSRRARPSASASFFEQPRVWMKEPAPVRASAIVHELQGDAPVFLTERRHRRLELVLARGEHAQGIALDLHLDLLEALTDALVHRLGLVVEDALGDGHALADGAAQRLLDLAVLERPAAPCGARASPRARPRPA